MTYSFVPSMSRVAELLATQAAMRASIQSNDPAPKLFALIDIAQIPKAAKLLHHAAPGAPHRLLFADNFAKTALALSPVLVELDAEPETATQQIIALDAVCRQLPVMSLLQSAMTLDQLDAHLQSLLLIESDGMRYLLRLADTQMVRAADSIFQPQQRSRFYMGLTAWLTVDHHGSMDDLCAHPQTQPTTEDLPLQLDAAQADALLTAVIVPTVASQIRHLDPGFARQLTHAEQTAFVTQAIDAARDDGITNDDAMIAWTITHWHTVRDNAPRP